MYQYLQTKFSRYPFCDVRAHVALGGYVGVCINPTCGKKPKSFTNLIDRIARTCDYTETYDTDIYEVHDYYFGDLRLSLKWWKGTAIDWLGGPPYGIPEWDNPPYRD